jgi:hypothetical protein
MPRIDDVKEVVLDSPPKEVYKALLDEVSGVTSWWMPHMAFKLKGNIPIDHEGAVYEATINPTSRMNVKFSAKMKDCRRQVDRRGGFRFFYRDCVMDI